VSAAPGPTKDRSLASFTEARKGIRAKPERRSSRKPEAWAMVSTSSTPGTNGWPGKWPSNTGLASGTRASAERLSSSAASTRSII
jgi:hypothetical protein